MKAIRFSASLYLVLMAISVNGQDLGSWNILNLKHSLNKQWSLTAEGQLRSLRFYNDFHYYEVTGTVSYQPTSSLRWTLGGGSYQTYGEGGDFVLPKNQEEWRVWPQVTLLQPLRNVNLEHRYRWELRFTDKGYRNRYRYRFGVAVPVGQSKKKDYKPLQVTGTGEIFFTDRSPYFERLRIMTGLNYRFSRTTSVITGYLYQFDYKLTDETGRDFLIVGFYYEFLRNSSGSSHTHPNN